jgi:hypothetical protein
MPFAYIYLIMMADGVYKIGRTEQEYGTQLKRLKSYPADSVIVYVRKVQNDLLSLENHIIDIFRNEFGKHPRGNEYFIGDENRMIEIINGSVNQKPTSMFDKHPLKKFIKSDVIILDPSKYCPMSFFIVKYKEWCRRNDIKSSRFNENFYNDVFSYYSVYIKPETLLWRGSLYSHQNFVFGLNFKEYADDFLQFPTPQPKPETV